MKRILLMFLPLIVSIFSFSNEYEIIKFDKVLKSYHSYTDGKYLHTHAQIGIKDGKTYFNLEEYGNIEVLKTDNGYEALNKSVEINRLSKGDIESKINVIFHEEKENFFHSDQGYLHLHLEFLENYKKVKISNKIFKLKQISENEYMEENGNFLLTLNEKKLELKADIKFFELKSNMGFGHTHSH